MRGRVADYLLAQFELEKYPEEGFDVNILPQDMVPATVRRWRDYLRHQKANPVWASVHEPSNTLPSTSTRWAGPPAWRDRR